MKKLIWFSILILLHLVCYSQDSIYARKIIDTLTSKTFWGRGYTNGGMQKAANYIASEMKAYNLEPLSGNNYFQSFSYPVNTFPGKMQLFINGRELIPGVDFIVSPESHGAKVKGQFSPLDSAHFTDAENRIAISIENKLTWSVANKQAKYTSIKISRQAISTPPLSYQLNIDANWVKKYSAVNVCGRVKGTSHPDSTIVFTAHYDHLGGMGANTFFPGANDNASGVALLLSLAKYYAANPQPYSIAFICFAGEEAGLIGSKYFTEQPLLQLHKIKFLTNVDLVGTGIEGITVVNATEFPKQFAALNTINNNQKLLEKINPRGKAANSDHYWFTEKGVPAFFIYTLGGIAAYHDVFDISVTLPLTEYCDLFKLLVAFSETLIK